MRESGYTLGFRRRIAYSGSHGETRAFRTGPLSLPSERSTRFGNPAWPGFKTANFAAFGAWSWVLPKNAESLRDSDALMRVAVPKASRPRWAACFFRFCRNYGLYALRSGPFRVCEARGGVTTLSALYVLLKRRTAACQNGSFAVFWSQVAIIDSSGAKCVPLFTKTAAVHCKQPRFPMNGTGAVFLRHFIERARNAAICARVQVAAGSKRPPPTPAVIPFSMAQATACA